MHAWRLRRGRSGGHDRETPRAIRGQRMGFLIVYVAVEDCDRALFAKLKTIIRREMKSLRAVVRRNRHAVVLAGVRASNVEPASRDINRLAELNIDRGVVWHIQTILDWVGSRDGELIHRRRLLNIQAD